MIPFISEFCLTACKHLIMEKAGIAGGKPISYLKSSFLTAHVGSTKRATLERSVRGAVSIGCSKTM